MKRNILFVIATLASAPLFGAADDTANANACPGSRHVERVVKTYGRECGYDTPVQEVHIVQHPLPDKDGIGCPLYVVLHSAGHDADKALNCTFMPDNHNIYRAPDDFYALYLDCRMAKGSDWWWGANKCSGFALSPCERRLLATIEETVVKYSIDRDRIYLCGNSMGGSGTLGLGLRHGDVFAAIKANVPALVKHACGRMGWDMERDADAAGIDFGNIPDPPLLVDYSAQNDKWSEGHEHLVSMMRARKYPWMFLWADFGHANVDSVMLAKNDVIHALDWTKVRKSDVLPAFSNASCDNEIPWPGRRESKDAGQINAFFRWADGKATDSTVTIKLFLANLKSRHFTVPDRAVADVTLRRLGALKVKRGDSFSWTYGGKTGSAVVGADGLLTVPGLEITKEPQTLKVTPGKTTAKMEICKPGATDDAAKMCAEKMNPGSALRTVERIGGGEFKVLVYGNSIALHGPLAKIGWTNNWGMAASAPEKDFAHLVVAGLEAKLGRKADFRIRNLAALERNFTTNVATIAEIAVDAAWKPDYVVVALGENARGVDEASAAVYRNFLADVARPFADAGSRIVMRSPFWKNAVKAQCTAMAAADVGATYVDAGDLGGKDENKAIGIFAHSGVANHPGDLGMRRIADLILDGFAAPRVARTIRPAGTGFTFNPELNTFLPLNDDYEVMLGGRKAEVRACRESRIPFNRYWPGRQRPLDQTERASYLAFEAEGEVACRVTPKIPLKKAVVRPLSAGVKPVVADGAISFMLPRPGYYVLETDGPNKALHIFMEPPPDFAERESATLSYGPGMHMAGLVRLKDHDRVYVDRDAIVFGCFTGENVRDVKIFGHGVIDGRVCERVFEGGYTPLQQSCLRFHGSRGVSIDGPILVDSPCWVLACFDCEDVDIRHVKIVGQWRYNTDGIDICNSRRVAVRDCFVRAFDDAMVIKGVPLYRDKAVEDIAVERCVLWCGWGNTVEPGIETWTPYFRNVRFSDCDVIRSSRNALNVSAGGSAVMEEFLFENIRVEMQADNRPEILQRSDDQHYDSDGRTSFPTLVKIDNHNYVKLGGEPLGHVRNCTFRNIKVLAEPGVPPPQIRIMSQTPPGGVQRQFEDIVLEDFSINGVPADWSRFNFTTNTPISLGVCAGGNY